MVRYLQYNFNDLVNQVFLMHKTNKLRTHYVDSDYRRLWNFKMFEYFKHQVAFPSTSTRTPTPTSLSCLSLSPIPLFPSVFLHASEPLVPSSEPFVPTIYPLIHLLASSKNHHEKITSIVLIKIKKRQKLVTVCHNKYCLAPCKFLWHSLQ